MTLPQISSKAVRLERVSVNYRDVVAIRDVSLEVQPGEVLALLGPSGCGKTTLLRSVGGFVPHLGEIYIGNEPVGAVASHKRNIGMVFQDYALFPHMTVAQNIGFGLRMRRVPKETIAVRVDEALKLVGLDGFNARMAKQLSGGQQQRVALARALVIQPAVLLLDEPLSALDKKLREEMRGELKRIQRVTGVTTIFVTHDQDEALALADRLAVMYRGEMQQFGAPQEVYRNPKTRFVAEFMGAGNVQDAVCREVGAGGVVLEVAGVGRLRSTGQNQAWTQGAPVRLHIRPEQVRIAPKAEGARAGALLGTVKGKTYLGRHIEFEVALANGTSWTAHVRDEPLVAALEPGAEVSLEADPAHVIVFATAPDSRA